MSKLNSKKKLTLKRTNEIKHVEPVSSTENSNKTLDDPDQSSSSNGSLFVDNDFQKMIGGLELLNNANEKKFRIINKRIFLTYPSHIDPETWLEWYGSNKSFKNGNKKIERYSIVHEVGKTGHKHTHILLEFNGRFDSTNSRIFDYHELHPNIRKVTSTDHWNNCVKYLSKQNTPYTNIQNVQNVIEKLWENKNVSEALLNVCTNLSEVGGIIAAMDRKPLDLEDEPETSWFPWQQELYDELSVKCTDDRKIIWYYDDEGCSGKTKFSIHMGRYKGAITSTNSDPYHVATIIDGFVKQKGRDSILIIIFNFTRDYNNHKIYSAIEQCKDGMITVSKYHSRTLYFDSPHVVVFSNAPPHLDKISKDRWEIRKIDKNRKSDGKSVIEVTKYSGEKGLNDFKSLIL